MGEVEILKEQIKELNEELTFFQNSQKDIIKQALEEFTNKKQDSLKSEFERKFRKNKKEIIKQKILESAKTTPILADLKYYIVNQLEYCSKASFYRYIEGMKDIIEVKDNVVHVVKKVTV